MYTCFLGHFILIQTFVNSFEVHGKNILISIVPNTCDHQDVFHDGFNKTNLVLETLMM